jgi:hypothetical protein
VSELLVGQRLLVDEQPNQHIERIRGDTGWGCTGPARESYRVGLPSRAQLSHWYTEAASGGLEARQSVAEFRSAGEAPSDASSDRRQREEHFCG